MFRKKTDLLTDGLWADLQHYIDTHYFPLEERRGAALACAKEKERVLQAEEERIDVCYDGAPRSMPPDFSDTALLDLDLQVDEPFSLKLLRLIDKKGMQDVACYKKANVSRQTWYKIMNESGYKPNKKTVLSFAVALELTLDETQMLLESVGFVLSQSSLFDVILMYCLSHEIYDVATIDEILYQHDQETLYSKG